MTARTTRAGTENFQTVILLLFINNCRLREIYDALNLFVVLRRRVKKKLINKKRIQITIHREYENARKRVENCFFFFFC